MIYWPLVMGRYFWAFLDTSRRSTDLASEVRRVMPGDFLDILMFLKSLLRPISPGRECLLRRMIISNTSSLGGLIRSC